MNARRLNRVSSLALSALSLTALLDVLLIGYARLDLRLGLTRPVNDEGLGAHLFQLAIAALAPVGLVFLATADWAEPLRMVRRLAWPGVLTIAAFAGLFYLEHYYYPVR